MLGKPGLTLLELTVTWELLEPTVVVVTVLLPLVVPPVADKNPSSSIFWFPFRQENWLPVPCHRQEGTEGWRGLWEADNGPTSLRPASAVALASGWA